MRAQGLSGAGHVPVPRLPVAWLGGLLLAGCALGSAGLARAQASQPAPSAKPAQKPSSQSTQQPSTAPMVMGESPDSTEDTGGIPVASPAAAPAPSAKSAAPAAWRPVVPLDQLAGGSQPAAVSQPVASDPAPPIPVPANAGGDTARQQINDACANLLKMANDLKAAVDKTTKDELSVAVVRQAGQIEQLAHQVKDEMRPAVAGR